MILWQMPDSLKVTLRYYGPSVEDGTMPIADVLAALHGFSGAYGKVASRQAPDFQHELRVSAVHTHSFELGIFAFAILSQEPHQTAIIQVASEAARRVIAAVAKIISAKKHTKAKPYTVEVKGDNNTVVVVNAEGSKLELTPALYELFQSKIIDSELGRITSPLRRGYIDGAELSADGVDERILAEISESEKPYFDRSEVSETITRETQVEGTLISLNKERNRGTFRLQDGTSVSYQYSGERQDQFFQDFGYKGPVRVTCEAMLDESLRPVHLNIRDVQRIQRSLPFLERQ